MDLPWSGVSWKRYRNTEYIANNLIDMRDLICALNVFSVAANFAGCSRQMDDNPLNIIFIFPGPLVVPDVV
jgi:hypothetical protein